MQTTIESCSSEQLQHISNQVKRNHQEQGWTPYLAILTQYFGNEFYEVGGSIRNAAITVLHDTKPDPSDIDIIVPGDPLWVRKTADTLPGIVKSNSFGNRKWLIEGKEIDVNAMEDRAKTPQAWIDQSDLLIGAIAYGKDMVYDNGALRCIAQKLIERNCTIEPPFPHSSIVKMLDLERRLEFTLGPQAIKYIATSDVAPKMREYMQYKQFNSDRSLAIMHRYAQLRA